MSLPFLFHTSSLVTNPPKRFLTTFSNNAMAEIDAAFVQHPEHRPRLSFIKAEGIPVVNLTALSDPSSIEVLGKEIGESCKEWGCFQVTNHGVPLSLRQRIDESSRKFFAQSLEEKEKVSRNETNPTGYYDSEHTKTIRDWKEVLDFQAKDPTLVPVTCDEHDNGVTYWTNSSPEYPPNFRFIVQEYIQEMEKLAFKLMELIALSLGLEAKRFEQFFIEDQTSYLRFNHYPPCPCPHLALGLGRHTDSGALTILSQDEVGGLEIKRKVDQEWVRVEPNQDTYIIIVGDIIEVWSNGAYESVEHRAVVNSEKERLSISFFFFPAHYTQVKPLEELINDQKNPSKYRPYNWGKLLVSKKGYNFKKRNVEDVRIDQFKIP